VNAAVVGGGLSGLAAACELAERGHRVTVFERRPWAGGKTYSRPDRDSGEAVDNGQHVFMGCTTEYIAFLRKLGTLHLTRRQARLRVEVRDLNGGRSVIRADHLPAPLHLARSFLGYGQLTMAERWQASRGLFAAMRLPAAGRELLDSCTFVEWLRRHGQGAAVVERFWDFLILPTLNCRAAEASARDALFVLQEGFLKSPRAAAIGLSRVGLSELHVEPAVRYIEERGGRVVTGTEVQAFEEGGQSIRALRVKGRAAQRFDTYVCAVPHTALPGLLPPPFAESAEMVALRRLPTAPIINLHCWFDRPVADFAFAAFAGCELQWVFNRARIEREPAPGRYHLVVSLSGACEFMGLTRRELEERFVPQLRRALPGARCARLLQFVAIKEPEATFVPAPGIVRPESATPYHNLVLAGAYTATGWPATMESAVRSGMQAARLLDERNAAGLLAPLEQPTTRAS